MIAKLAALVCIVFVVYLFRQDIKSNPKEPALWIPFIWMFLAGSRWASSWLNLSPPLDSVDAYSEGSPIDRAVFLALIVAGFVVLARRKVDWGGLLLANKLFAAYLLYCLLSITWSDAPFVAFKRWVKDLGGPIMALVILTTPNALQALTQTLRRLSYLLLPLSVLFVRYYPELGRVYHVDGTPMYTGVGHQKNDLGLMCLVTGMYFLWQILLDRERFRSWTRGERFRIYILTGMMAWLLYMSNSQTSLACLMMAGATILATRLPFVRANPKRLVGLVMACGLTYASLEAAFDVKEWVFALLGRDPSLTNRTELWLLLFSIEPGSLLGTGFMSFWSGERMEAVWSVMGAGVNQAHSGYIEQYLNLGYVGVGFMILLIFAALLNARSEFAGNPSMATLRLCFVLAAILYNYTEASFYGISNMWVLFLLALLKVPNAGPSIQPRASAHGAVRSSVETSGSPRNPGPTGSIAIGSGVGLRPSAEHCTRQQR